MDKQESISNPIPGFTDDAVAAAIDLMGTNGIIHNKHEGIWRMIQRLFEMGFEVSNPEGSRKISSKLIVQLLWKVVGKMKPLDFSIQRAGPFKLSMSPSGLRNDLQITEWKEKIVTDTVATVMKEGKYNQCLRDKGGVFMKSAIFGDSHLQVGYDESKGAYPISFRVCSLSDVYMNNSATEIRDAVDGLSADQMVLIYRYTMAQFNELYPEFKGKVAPGDIPRPYRYKKQLEKTWLQTTYVDKDIIEVAHFFSIDKTYCVFAGAACTVIEKLEAKDYPFVMDDKAYIPVLHWKFFPSTEGYYNYGIGHMVYDLAIIAARMDNMAYNHAEDNIWPINLVNVPQGQASKLFNKILQAHEQRAAGGKGYAINEYDKNNPQSGATLEPFQTAPITQEWERAFTRLEQQITRLGFQLDAVDRGQITTATQILAEEENADASIKQIMEFNASETEQAVLMTMNAIREFISDDDETPINSSTTIEIAGMDVPMRSISMGWVAKELRENKYFVVVNSRSGTIPSNIMEQTQVNRALMVTPPGSPAYLKLASKLMKLNGQDIKQEELGGMPQANSAQQEEGLMPSETDELKATGSTLKNIAAI